MDWLTDEQLANAVAKVPAQDYREWFGDLPKSLREAMTEAWGEPPGQLYTDDDGAIVLAALRFGNVVLMIQPPRGFGENPVAIYHDPELAPSHHYLAAYQWLRRDFGADAMVHLGKHGTLVYGRDLDGVEARGDMERTYRRIQVAAKNADTREHDIADSDDYFQYHGGMVAMVRHLTGKNPKAYVGDSAVPSQVRTRSLAEETNRVFRSRVVTPRWMAAMRRHGYKGAFEMAATVDYLFGYDATASVVDDWMYETLT